MKILVTGANGLLGKCVVRALSGAHEVTQACHANAGPGQVAADIGDPDAVQRLFASSAFTHVVNCAGLRSPEYCRQHPEDAYRVNGLAVEFLAAGADRAGALLCHISTDYVFPGTRPPYREEATPAPVNIYGRTKLAGEHAARSAARHLVVRIPALYRTDLGDPRNAATEFSRWLKAGERRVQDAITIRYYTLADDVAEAIRFALEKGLAGTLHVSAAQKTTKAEFARKLAAAIGADPSMISDAGPAASEDRRPHDSHLDTSLYESLGGRPFTGIAAAMQAIRGGRSA